MAHFARVDRALTNDENTGKVLDVIVADQEFIDNHGGDFGPGDWIQTSYNTSGGVHYVRNEDGAPGEPSADQTKALRYNFASVDGLYDYEADAFYGEQPYPSFTLNTSTYLWEPPCPLPTDDPRDSYKWSEDQYNETENGWVFIGRSPE